MTRSQELLVALKQSPRDEAKLEALVRFFSRKDDWDGLYSALGELVESVQELETLEWIRGQLVGLVQRHIDTLEDSALAGALKLRMANLMAEHLGQQEEAVVLIAEAFEHYPSRELLDRALVLLEQMKELRFAARLIQNLAQAEENRDRAADLWLRLGYTRLSLGELAKARDAFQLAAKAGGSAGKTGLREVERLEGLLERANQEIQSLEQTSELTDDERMRLGRMKLSLEPANRSGLNLLLEVFFRNPEQVDLFNILLEGLRETGRFEDLAWMVEARLKRASDPDEKLELTLELARVCLINLKDQARGEAMIEELHRLAPASRRMVRSLASLWSELGEWEKVFELYERARRETTNRDEERWFLEEEALLAWRKLKDMERAERLFRRARSIDPKNRTSLLFYEDYYTRQEDYRKLYTTLSTRQAVARDSEKVELLLRMADMADVHLESPERSIDSLKKVILLDPEHREAAERLKALYEREGKWHALIDFLDSSVNRLGDDRTGDKLEILWTIEDIYLDPARLPIPEMALATLKRIVQVDPNNLKALGLLADKYRETRRWSALAEILEHMATLVEDRLEALDLLRELARLWGEQIRNERKAMEVYEQILDLEPQDREVQTELAGIYRTRGLTEKLYAVLQSQLDLLTGSERGVVLDELSRIAVERLKRPEEGVFYLEQLLDLDPRSEVARQRLQRVYAQLEDWESLVDLLEVRVSQAQRNEEKIPLMEQLGEILLDKLEDPVRARPLFQDLLALHPRSRIGKESLRKLFILERDWQGLRELFSTTGDLAGYGPFLEDTWRRTEDPVLARDLGWELVRSAETLFDDKERGFRYLVQMLDKVPDDLDVARSVLERSAEVTSPSVAKALAVIADNTEGDEAEEAALKLAEQLEEAGELEECHARTLSLLVRQIQRGEMSAFDTAVDRADAADLLAELVEVVEGMIPDIGDRDLAMDLTVRLAGVLRTRMRDLERARGLLEVALEEDPRQVRGLEELERIHLARGSMEDLEQVLTRMVEVALDQEFQRDKLLSLARLHEEIMAAADRAYEDYRRIVDLNPADREGFQGMVRTLEQLEQYEDMAQVLEQQLSVTEDRADRFGLMLRIGRLYWRRLQDGDRAASWAERLMELEPDAPEGIELVRELFDANEAPELVIPILKGFYEKTEAWEELNQVLIVESGLEEDAVARYELLVRSGHLVMDKLGREEEAYETFIRALSINVEDPSLREVTETLAEMTENLSGYLGFLGGMAGVEGLELGVEVEPELGVELCLQVVRLAREKLGDAELAIKAARRARDLDPDNREHLELVLELLRSFGRDEELLELLKEKEQLVWDGEERKLVYREIYRLLIDRLDRAEEGIEWLEQAHLLDEADGEVAEELEQLYSRFERWSDLISLMQSRLAHLEGEERSQLAYQLSLLLMDKQQDLAAAVDLLQGLLAAGDSSREASAQAMISMLSMEDVEGYQDVALRICRVLEPVLREHEDWDQLAMVLEAQAHVAENPAEGARAWLGLADLYESRLEQPEGAFQAAAEAVKLDPDNQDAPELLALLADSQGRQEELLEILLAAAGDIAICTAPHLLGTLVQLLKGTGERRLVLARVLDRLTELHPEELSAYEQLAELYEELDQRADQIRVLENLAGHLEDQDRLAEVRKTIGELMLSEGRLGDASEVLRPVLERITSLTEARDQEAFVLMESVLSQQESWYELQQLLVRKAELWEDLEERKHCLMMAADILEDNLDDPAGAVEIHRRIRGLDPMDRQSGENLERLLSGTESWGELARHYLDELELVGEGEEALSLRLRLAEVLLRHLERIEDCLGHLGMILEKEPTNPDAGALLQEMVDLEIPSFQATEMLEAFYIETEQWSRLAQVYQTQIDGYPADISEVEKFRALAELYEEHLDDMDGAFIHMSQAFRREPESETIHEKLLLYTERRGSWDELFDIYLDVLVELDRPEDRNDLRKKMSRLFHDRLGDTERAEMLYRDILDDDPADLFALERLGQLYRETSDWEKLVEVLRQGEMDARDQETRIRLLFEMATICSEQLEAHGEALDALETILSLDPTQGDAYRALEAVHFAEGDLESAAAVIQRELDIIEDPLARGEVRLRLAGLLALELKDLPGAMTQLEEARAEGFTEGLTEFMEGLREDMDRVNGRFVELLAGIYLDRSAWDELISLYTWAAARSEETADRLQWFEKIFELRTELQKDPVGAYAAAKIMVSMDANEARLRDRIFEWASVVGELEDLASFVSELLATASLDDTAELELRLRLATLLQEQLGRGAEAAEHWEMIKELGDLELASKARKSLLEIRRGDEDQEAYVELLKAEAEVEISDERRVHLLLDAARILAEVLDRPDDAVEIYQGLLPLKGRDPDFLDQFEETLVLFERGEELENLLRHRLGVVEDQDEVVRVRLRLAAALLERDLEEGIRELELVLEDEPDNETALTRLEAMLEAGLPEEGLQYHVAAVLYKVLPGDGDGARLQRVITALLQTSSDPGELLELQKKMARLLEASGEVGDALYHLGQALLLAAGDPSLEEEVRRLAGRTNAWQMLKDINLDVAEACGDPGLAVRYLEQAARLCLRELEDPDQAAELCRRIIDMDPLSGFGLETLEDHYQAREMYPELAEILETRSSTASSDVRGELGLRLADLYLERLEDRDRAVDWLFELLQNPDLGELAFEKLSAMYETEENWESLHDLLLMRASMLASPEEKLPILSKTAALEEQYLESFEDAISRYQEILELQSDSLFALNGLSRCYRNLDLHQELAEVNERLLILTDEDESSSILEELAELYIRHLGQAGRGLDMIRMLLGLDPGNGMAAALAEELIQSDDDLGYEASMVLEPYARDQEDWPTLVMIYTVQLDRIEDPEQRAEVARNSAEIMAFRMNDPAGGISVLTRVLLEQPDQPALVQTLTSIAESTGDWAAAAEQLATISEVALDSANRAMYFNLVGQIHEEHLNDPEAATGWYQRTLAEEPDHQEAFSAVEHLLQQAGSWVELARHYELGLATGLSGDQRKQLLIKLGFVRDGELGDKAGAIDVYRDVLAQDPWNEAVMNRLDAILTDEVFGLAAAEILEPLYRREGFEDRLPKVLKVKAGDMDGGIDRAQTLVEAAQSAAAAGQTTEAFDLFLSALREETVDHGAVISMAGALAEELGRWAELSQVLDTLQPLRQERAVELMQRHAIILFDKLGDMDAADLKLRDLLGIDPDNSMALNLLIRILEEDGDRDMEIMPLLHQLVDLADTADDRKRLLLQLADKARGLEEFGLEMDALQRVLDMDPSMEEALDRMEELCRAGDDWERLVEVLDRRILLVQGTESIPLRLELARVLAEHLGRSDRALGVLENVMALWPGDLEVVKALVGRLALQEDWRRVVSVLREFASQEDVDLELRVDRLREALAVARDRLEDSRLALTLVEQLLALDPEDQLAQESRILLLEEGSSPEEVVAACDLKLETMTNDREKAALLLKTGRILAAEGISLEDVVRRFESSLSLDPEQVDARLELIELYERLERWEDAVLGHQIVASTMPRLRVQALKSGARICLDRMNDPKEASSMLHELQAADLLDNEATDLLVRSLEVSGQHQALVDLLTDQLKKEKEPERRSELCRGIAVAYRDGLGNEGKFLSWIEEAWKAREDPRLVEELLAHYRRSGDLRRVASLLQWKVDYLLGKRKMRDLPELLVELGKAWEALGDLDRALAAYDQCDGVDASYLPNQLAHARVLMARKESDKALRIYQMLTMRINELPEAGDKVEVFFNLAVLARDQRDLTKAKQYLNRLLLIQKDFKPALDMLRELSS